MDSSSLNIYSHWLTACRRFYALSSLSFNNVLNANVNECVLTHPHSEQQCTVTVCMNVYVLCVYIIAILFIHYMNFIVHRDVWGLATWFFLRWYSLKLVPFGLETCVQLSDTGLHLNIFRVAWPNVCEESVTFFTGVLGKKLAMVGRFSNPIWHMDS